MTYLHNPKEEGCKDEEGPGYEDRFFHDVGLQSLLRFKQQIPGLEQCLSEKCPMQLSCVAHVVRDGYSFRLECSKI
jgi:hypothetical protein